MGAPGAGIGMLPQVEQAIGLMLYACAWQCSLHACWQGNKGYGATGWIHVGVLTLDPFRRKRDGYGSSELPVQPRTAGKYTTSRHKVPNSSVIACGSSGYAE